MCQVDNCWNGHQSYQRMYLRWSFIITSMKSSIVAEIESVFWHAFHARTMRTIFVSHQDFTVKDLVIPKHVVNYLFVQVLRWGCERDLHTTRLFSLQVDIAAASSIFGFKHSSHSRTYGGSLFRRIPTESNSASSKARCSARFVASNTIKIKSLV